ncbi:chaplin family protein [Actinomadura sp. BRA 177]|uniref:chaplin family protein n=1 Tax=Actinomadura sp. BRA 177 TaxID=2745202 RepID=UPI0015952166|nr:chaplin family protein [Actinomadura sp. BRA 177]
MLAAGFVALGVTAIPSNAFADVTNGDAGVLSGNQIDAPISAPVDVSGNGAALLGTGHATSHGGVKIHKRGGSGQETSGAHGIASGNQVNAPISLPVHVCGNAVGVLGQADAGCEGGAKVNDAGKGGQLTDGTGGVIAGNQVNAPISAPVNVCGNAVALAGDAVAGCEGGSLVKNGGITGSGQETSGIFGVGSGNQGNVPISVPVDLCGNAVNGTASCEGGASVRNGGHRTGGQLTDGAFGIIAGNQANAPISAPVTACGDAAALAGQAWSFCEGGAHARSSSGGDQHTSGIGGIIAGNQGNAPISIPVEVCGDAAAVVGVSAASCNGQTLVEGSHGSGAQTSGDHGAGSGNQANAPVQTPADACGNAAAVIGIASALCEDGPGYGGYHPYSRTTSPTSVPRTPDVPTTNGVLAGTPALLGNGLPGTTAAPLPRTVPASNARHAQGVPTADGVLADNALPEVGGLPQAGGVPEMPVANGRRGQGDLPVSSVPGDVLDGVQTVGVLPALDGRRVRGGVPAADGVLGNNALPQAGPEVAGLPVANGRRAQGVLPGMGSLPMVNVLSTNGALPKVGGPVVLGDLAKARGVRERKAAFGLVRRGDDGAPVAVSVLDTRALPDGSVVRKAIGRQAVDSLRGVAVPATPVAGHEVVPVTGEIGPVRNVAAEEVVSDGGSLWALAASGVLGVVAGALALARRVRMGGRR